MNFNTYPFNYLKSIRNPITAFQNRHQLKWSQIAVVFTFITFLMTAPVYTHYQKVESFSFYDFYPEIVDMIDEEVISEIQQIDLNNGEMTNQNSFKVEADQGTIVIHSKINTNDYEDAINFLGFEKKQFVVRDDSEEPRIVPYLTTTSFKGKNKEQIIEELSEAYTITNGSGIIVSLILVIYGFILLFNAFVIFVYAYLLKSMQDFTMSSIITYRESVNLVLNLIAIPTILAMIFGFIRFNLITMFGIQVIALIAMLVYLFQQTQFIDEEDRI